MIKVRGADGVSDVYTYLATRGEALGFIVACAPIGGFIEGVIGSKVCVCMSLCVRACVSCTRDLCVCFLLPLCVSLSSGVY